MPSTEQIIQQSKSAYNQWCEQWRAQAKTNAQYKQLNLLDFENIGVGRAVLCIANGYSFEENLETIKKYQHNVDIMACDKTLGHCLANGIRPKYVLLCDANVNYEKYLEPWKDDVRDITLFMNVCGNPKWSAQNWKAKYFFVNKDVINSEIEFQKISGCPNLIAAATNVSNAMVVFLTQSDNGGRNNFFGYDKILLIGYDYSWRPGLKYYAFDEDGGGKANYMRHIYTTTHAGSLAYSSGNLAFSAGWLEKYIKSFKLPVVQCSKDTLMSGYHFGDLESNMQYAFRPGDSHRVCTILKERNALALKVRQLEQTLRGIGTEHYYASFASII